MIRRGTRPSGPFLAMDTSGKAGSVALGIVAEGGAEILGRSELEEEEEHASLLVPRVRTLMETAGVSLTDLEGVVVGAGPGSFTGVRVAAATAKGLSRALSVPLWAFSSLAAAAVAVAEASLHPRCVLFDARSDRLYAAAYAVRKGELETLLEPMATTVGALLDGGIPPGAVLMGEGALRHRSILEGADHPVLPPPAGIPDATGLLRILSMDPEVPPVEDPGRWEPDYLRPSGAERTWKVPGHGRS